MDALVRPSIADGRGRPSYDLVLGQALNDPSPSLAVGDRVLRLLKQSLVHDPHVGGVRGLAILKILDEELSRLAGELAPGGMDLERVVDLRGECSLHRSVRRERC